MEKQIKIALAGNPNSGKTTLFNALTGSNQFVGNWPGVTVEKKEGKLKKHDDVAIMDLPGIYSLSPYTLEEVVARNYLITERPDAILNIIDGTNLERNLYLTTQLTELGIPVVIAINMMDVVRKNGDKINVDELSRELGCKIVEISALKGEGIMEAAEAAVQAAKSTKTVPMHTFSGPVEHAIAHIEEAAVHNLPEEQQRWYAIKIFERDDKVLDQLKIDPTVMAHIEEDIKAAEKELDDDAESIITNERYVYIAEIIKACYKKKNAGQLSASDKIDRVVTNRWLGLPIFALVMFLVYYISMVTVGSAATDWANDGLFGDGWHLLGIGSKAYTEASDEYTAATQAVDAFLGLDTEAEDFDAGAALARIKSFVPTSDTATVDVEDEETLAVNTMTAYYDALPQDADKRDDVVQMTYVDAAAYLEANGFEAPDPADYGVWVPGVPVLVGNALESAGAADWLSGLILDGIVAGVGAVLGFVPQMLVLFLMLAVLEDIGYMARIAFIMDRIMHRIGLHGKSFIPLIMGFGCNVPAVMACRTIESRSSRLITILITPFMSCSARLPIYILLIGTFFPAHAGLMLFGLYIVGILLAVLTARLMRRFMFPVDETPFVMELPPYRIPTMRATLSHMWDKCAQYLRKMGGLILVASIVVWFLSYYPRQDTAGPATDHYENSYLGRIGKACEPIFAPLGLNWKANVAILSGVAAKEVVVSTLGVLYADGEQAPETEEQITTLSQRLRDSGDFDAASALALLVFLLVYFPCLATVAAIASEAGWRWAALAVLYDTGMAWLLAWMAYHLMRLF